MAVLSFCCVAFLSALSWLDFEFSLLVDGWPTDVAGRFPLSVPLKGASLPFRHRSVLAFLAEERDPAGHDYRGFFFLIFAKIFCRGQGFYFSKRIRTLVVRSMLPLSGRSGMYFAFLVGSCAGFWDEDSFLFCDWMPPPPPKSPFQRFDRRF